MLSVDCGIWLLPVIFGVKLDAARTLCVCYGAGKQGLLITVQSHYSNCYFNIQASKQGNIIQN